MTQKNETPEKSMIIKNGLTSLDPMVIPEPPITLTSIMEELKSENKALRDEIEGLKQVIETREEQVVILNRKRHELQDGSDNLLKEIAYLKQKGDRLAQQLQEVVDFYKILLPERRTIYKALQDWKGEPKNGN